MQTPSVNLYMAISIDSVLTVRWAGLNRPCYSTSKIKYPQAANANQESVIWIPGIGIFIILWDLPFPFEGQSVGWEKRCALPITQQTAPGSLRMGLHEFSWKIGLTIILYTIPSFRLQHLNSLIVLCKTPAFRWKIGNYIKPLYSFTFQSAWHFPFVQKDSDIPY